MIMELIKSVFAHKNKIIKEERTEIETIRRYKRLYKTADGKFVLDDILGLCRYGESSLGKSNEETYFNIGEQNIGIEIAQRLNADLKGIENGNDEA